MQMRPELQIQSIIKALTDVVLPAVDPQNKLAQEQARLILGTLNLMAQQLPLQFRFDCDELKRLIAFAHELQDEAAGAETAALAELAASASAASGILERAGARPDEVSLAVRSLRAAGGAVVTAVFKDADAPTRYRVQKTVLAMSSAQLLRERSWVLMQGWEPDPKSVPAIDTLLSAQT